MFESLSERLTTTLKKLRGQGRLTEQNMSETLREVRKSLLEADVALPVVKLFINHIRSKALGQDVMNHLNPGQALIKIVENEMTEIMGKKRVPLDLKSQPPAIILMAGLQGSGKTTTVAKLARHLIEVENKKVMLASTDVYRPAAIDQLQRLAVEVNANFFPTTPDQKPLDIAKQAAEQAKQQFQDVLIVDTAGRLHIDDAMMAEIKNLHQQIKPVETLFVVDSMTGQDAANTAKAFNDALAITGVILTKVDGDARGGAALSVREITGKPIKFLGTGEKTEGLEPFHPDRLVSRILGMGDILSLIEEAEQKIDKEKSDKFAKKIRKGKGFDLQDFKDQIEQMSKMGGGMAGMLSKLPGMAQAPTAAQSAQADNAMNGMLAIINSMTKHERHFPAQINGSRKKRIATGSGKTIQDVNKVLKQFKQMEKMMKKFSKPGMLQKMMERFG